MRSLQDKKDLQVLFEDLGKREIAEESTSVWLNPIVLVKKKTGKLRFCIDFRKLDSLAELDQYRIPKISELLATLHDQKYFSTIDLKNGFFQIDINKCHREKTVFHTGTRFMQFVKMPQGFKNSPGVFQRVMDYVLKDIIGQGYLVYLMIF